MVKQGNTKVLVATTIQIGQPSPDMPDHGDVVVTLHRKGPNDGSSSYNADVLQAWLQRMLDELLPSELNVWTGKACIRLVVSVMILQDSGNVKDAALLSCMAAWRDTQLPTMDQLQEVDGKLWWKGQPTTSLDNKETSEKSKAAATMRNIRVSLTMGIIQLGEERKTKFLVDPSALETGHIDGCLTVSINLPSRTLQVEYSGSVALTATDLALAAKIAEGRADELANIL